MKKLLKFAVCLALLVMVVVLFTGCKATGGGSFMSCDKKCTFGFVAQGTETDGSWDYKGQFQFNDHNGAKIHINEMALVTVVGPVANFTGWDKKNECVVNVTVTDLGEPGAGPGDLILIEALGPGLWGVWGGVVQGNIQVH
jgi:hypothetical protein